MTDTEQCGNCFHRTVDGECGFRFEPVDDTDWCGAWTSAPDWQSRLVALLTIVERVHKTPSTLALRRLKLALDQACALCGRVGAFFLQPSKEQP